MQRHREQKGRPPTSRSVTFLRLPRIRAVLALAAMSLAGAALVSGLLFYSLSSDEGAPSGPRTAAIVDQLSLSFPNPTFIDVARGLLEQGGYSVDYYPGEQVTVEFYRNLPTRDYDLLVLRVHSGLARDWGEPTGYVSLFSGEPYAETKYAREVADGLLGRAMQYEGGPEYFGIVPEFIESSMRGTFEGTTILMMGCDGLVTDITAEALVRKGAKTVLGWSGPVSATYTDSATERLLDNLLVAEHPVHEAVVLTMAEVGPDPEFDSSLLVYPPEG